MKKTNVTFKATVKFIATILSWALFVILISCAVFLLIYYLNNRINISKNSNYKPAVSIYTIVSPSMVPTINVLDVIVNRRVNSPTEIKEGDIITFISTSSISEGKTVTHRVSGVEVINGDYQYKTKGDNNLSEDGRPALYSNVIGKAVFKIPQLGQVQMFVASKWGWIAIVIVPALYIIIKDIYKIVKISKLKKRADEENSNLLSNTNSDIINDDKGE